jgi:hypothetical protein
MLRVFFPVANLLFKSPLTFFQGDHRGTGIR